VETYGCTSNKADSAIMADLLRKADFTQTRLEEATFVIINTCGVKQQTENKIVARLKELQATYGKDPDKKLIIAGCLPHISSKYLQKIQEILPSFAAIIDLDNIHEIEDICDRILKGEKDLILLSDHLLDKSEFLIDYPQTKNTGIVPISEGCLGACTYCCVKNARGKLQCYNPETIVRNVEHQLRQGIKQIYLTSQDCSLYESKSTNLYHLVRRVNELDYEFFLRLGMINPRMLKDHLDQLLSILELEQIYQFLHIPIQSGSSKILKTMQRPYTISEIVDPIETLRKKFPHLTLSTDIICGFPGETEYDFYRTLNFIKWLRPEILNISKFTPRPGTKAKKMEQVDGQIIKQRSARLSHLFRILLEKTNLSWGGWQGKVLMLHQGSEPHQAFGRNFAYKNVFINDYKGEYGVFRDVEINRVEGFNLFGKLLKKEK